jgi:hypothetical protein
MKIKSIAGVFVAVFVLSAAPLLAQEKNNPCRCGDSSQSPDKDRVVDESLATWIKESEIVYETEDGNLYWWLEGYNEKARTLLAAGDEAGLENFIREIAGNYRFGNERDEEGFIEWARTARPWEIRE